MTTRWFFPCLVAAFVPVWTRAADPALLTLATRSRVEAHHSSNDWQVIEKELTWDARQTALIVCDMWDKHWCAGATRRVAEMAPRMNELLRAARARGVLVIHCPSETMKYYEGTPARKRAQAAPKAEPKVPLQRWCGLDRAHEALLPIDDSDGGCDDNPPCKSDAPYPWTRQIDTIEVADTDAVTDSAEAYYLLQERGIDHVLVLGVHLNMCVLGRPFSIRQMVGQGKDVLLVRDMTDTMYNSRRRPFVPHTIGTELMIEHVEKYWCPTVSSVGFLGGSEFRFAEDRRPEVLFLIGDEEYKTGQTVPAWARAELAWRGVRCRFVTEDSKRPGEFPGLETLPAADALFVSVKRRSLSPTQLDLIQRHVAAGKPVLGIRTASHAFGAQKVEPGRVAWDTFDRDVFGGHYQNHYGKGAATVAVPNPAALGHPLLTGVATNDLRFTSHLYKCRDLAPGTLTLWNGTRADQEVIEPVAWVRTNDQRRIFYTSLGAPEDFDSPAFRRLLLNAVLWSVQAPLPPTLDARR
jgi:nicotinamidase-related amidase/type 1 glutamine amidotransferase